MQDAPALCHAARRNHNRRDLRGSQLLRLLDGCDDAEAVRAECTDVALLLSLLAAFADSLVRRRVVGSLLIAELRLQLRVELVQTFGVARQRGRGHRAVDEYRQYRDAARDLEPPQPVDQLLHPPDGERRNDQFATLAERSR